MKSLEWSDELSVGVEQIDEQHKYFIGLINRLSEVVEKKEAKGIAKSVLQELWKYAMFHFATEEKYFEKFNYPGKISHTEEHTKLGLIVQKFIYKIEDRNYDYGTIAELIEFLIDWFIQHDQRQDKRYKEFFNQQGLN